jgi:hypothetical protein
MRRRVVIGIGEAECGALRAQGHVTRSSGGGLMRGWAGHRAAAPIGRTAAIAKGLGRGIGCFRPAPYLLETGRLH